MGLYRLFCERRLRVTSQSPPCAWQGYTAGPPTPQLSWLIWLNATVRVAAADFLLIRSGHLYFAPFIRRAAETSV
jgi:hypothetical protein